jgi:hypothetical protein
MGQYHPVATGRKGAMQETPNRCASFRVVQKFRAGFHLSGFIAPARRSAKVLYRPEIFHGCIAYELIRKKAGTIGRMAMIRVRCGERLSTKSRNAAQATVPGDAGLLSSHGNVEGW